MTGALITRQYLLLWMRLQTWFSSSSSQFLEGEAGNILKTSATTWQKDDKLCPFTLCCNAEKGELNWPGGIKIRCQFSLTTTAVTQSLTQEQFSWSKKLEVHQSCREYFWSGLYNSPDQTWIETKAFWRVYLYFVNFQRYQMTTERLKSGTPLWGSDLTEVCEGAQQ